MNAFHENPFPDRSCVIHELGHVFISALFAPRTDGICFYLRNPHMRAVASYSRANVSGSRQTVIAVAGAVASHQAAHLGNLGVQPLPLDVFLTDDDNVFPEFFGDRQTVKWYTAAASPEKKKRVIVRAVSRARRELAKFGGAPLLVVAADRIIAWLESDQRSKWREALGEPGTHATVFLSHRELTDILEVIAVSNAPLALGARRLKALIWDPWVKLERERQEREKAYR